MNFLACYRVLLINYIGQILRSWLCIIEFALQFATSAAHNSIYLFSILHPFYLGIIFNLIPMFKIFQSCPYLYFINIIGIKLFNVHFYILKKKKKPIN